MRDRLLLRIAYAHGFLKKLWVLTRPYWFAADRAAIGTGMFSMTVKESTIARLTICAFQMAFLIHFEWERC